MVDPLKKTATVAGNSFKQIGADSGTLHERPLQNAVDNITAYAQDPENAQDDTEAMLRRITVYLLIDPPARSPDATAGE